MQQPFMSIKLTYKKKTFILPGPFKDQKSIKQSIINRQDIIKTNSFIIQYQNQIKTFEQALINCKRDNKNVIKISIIKTKTSKNLQKNQNNQQQILQSNILSNSMLSHSASYWNHQQHGKNINTHQTKLNNINPQIKNNFVKQQNQQKQILTLKHTISQQIHNQKPKQIQIHQNIKNQNNSKSKQVIQLQKQIGFKSENQKIIPLQENRKKLLNEIQLLVSDQTAEKLKNVDNKQIQKQLPNFDVSQIHQSDPLKQQTKSTKTKKIKQNKQIKQHIQNQKTIKQEIKIITTCIKCQKNQIQPEISCNKCKQKQINQNFQKMSKQIQKSILIKLNKQMQQKIKQKVNILQKNYKKQTQKINQKYIDQQNKIKLLEKQNTCKQLQVQNKKQQKIINILTQRVLSFQKQFQSSLQKIKMFQNDFATVNKINFQLQHANIIFSHKIDKLMQHHQNSIQQKLMNFENNINLPSKKESSKKTNQKEEKIITKPNEQKISKQQKINKPQTKPQIKPQIKHQRKPEIKPQINIQNKPQIKLPNQYSNSQIKQINADMRQKQKITTLKLGQVYQPQIKIKNNGSKQWPSKVTLFQKVSKRTKQIPNLKPGEQYTFKDDIKFMAEWQGQNIQIKYQLCYQQKSQKIYLGPTVSIFIKVKKENNDKKEQNNEKQALNQSQKDEIKKIMASKQKSQKEAQKRLQLKKLINGQQNEYKQGMKQQLSKQQAFIKMINETKRRLNMRHKTTKQIKERLQQMGINEYNYLQADIEVIEQVTNNVQSNV